MKTTNTKEPDYKKGFDLLMEFWDYIPEEERFKLDRALKRLRL